MEHTPQLTFHITLWRPWLLAVTPLALLAGVALAISVANGQPASVSVLLLVVAGIAVILLVPIGLAIRASHWDVDPNAIGGPNNQFVYHRLQWSEIESVQPWLIPGYPYLQVNGNGKRRVFWLPLFLANMVGFRAAVARYAPPENALRRYLEQHPA
jgi:hypothetical protein